MPERGTPIDWEAIHEQDRQEIRGRFEEKRQRREDIQGQRNDPQRRS